MRGLTRSLRLELVLLSSRWRRTAPAALQLARPPSARAPGAVQAFRQQQGIGRQVKAVRQDAARLKTQAAALAATVERLEETALTFGDLENYLAVITAEVGEVASALRRIQQRQQAAQGAASPQRGGGASGGGPAGRGR